jgi:peptidylprolyl isomerase
MYMKRAVLLLLAAPALAESPARPAPSHHSAAGAPTEAANGCVTIPELSPVVPALPAGTSCPHALYTVTTVPSARLEDVSPAEGPDLAETLGLKPATFTLAYVDTTIGTGPLATAHKWYTVQYTGYLTDGTKFDSSRDRNQPIVLHIGEHNVIPGWDTGFAGMHVGGTRRLFIPYQLAYGATGRPPTIPAKSELIFDIELIAQDDTEPKPTANPEPSAAPGDAAGQPASSPPATTPGSSTH